MNDKQNIEQRFKRLLEKFRKNSFSVLEFTELYKIVNDEASTSEIEKKMYQELEEQDYSELATFDKEKLFRKLVHQLDEDEQHPGRSNLTLFYRFTSVAAVLILLFVVGGLMAYFMSEKKDSEKHLVSSCEIAAPLDKKIEVILPDSSVVWLNAGSKLTYSTNFNIDNRIVYLEGEGYFQVAKNNKQPFVVDADGLLIEGGETEFNVKAYHNEPTITTILVEGKVWLNHRTQTIASDVSLGRKYKATFYKQPEGKVLAHGQPRLVISPNVDPKPLISWKNDRFISRKSELMENIIDQGMGDLVMLRDLTQKNSSLEEFLGQIISCRLDEIQCCFSYV